MRMLYATLIVITLQLQRSSAFDLGGWFSDALESVKNSDPIKKVKDWIQGLQEWSSSEWDCGADHIWPTKLISKAMAQKKCPNVLEQLNKACRWHDICYSQGLEGQLVCDSKFCDALYAINFPSEEEQRTCDLPRAMCDTVKFGGALIYRDKTQQ